MLPRKNRQEYKMKCLEVYYNEKRKEKKKVKKGLLKKKASIHHKMRHFTTISLHVSPGI